MGFNYFIGAEAARDELLVLDPRIRDWVLLPLVAVMFLVAIFRHYVTKLLRSDRKPDMRALRDGQILVRSRRLRMNGNKIPQSAFLTRKHYFNNKENGIFREKAAPSQQDALSMATNPATNPMMDPSNMVDMMKKNMAMIVPQILIMTWVNYFFSGFVLVKLPFPLTLSFKSMLQRGIDLLTLDTSYVSSLSWYFLTLFGLRGLNSFFLGEANAADDAQMMQEQMGMGPSQMEIHKVYQSERENLELFKHNYDLDAAEKNILGYKDEANASKNPRGAPLSKKLVEKKRK